MTTDARKMVSLRDILLFLWSNDVVRRGVASSKVRAGTMHRVIAELAHDIEKLGVPLLFDHGPNDPHSRQVGTALEELIPFAVGCEESAFHLVLNNNRARLHIELLTRRLPADALMALEQMTEAFGVVLDACLARDLLYGQALGQGVLLQVV